MVARTWKRVLTAAGTRLATVAAALAGACAEPPRPPSVLLVTLDTTRADALACYGGAAATPALDRIAAEGVLFRNAYTVMPMTLPSHASMLTGLYPPRHGIRDNGNARLAPEARTLAEGAKSSGYRTAAFLATVVLDAAFGLDQGFDVYDTPTPRGGEASAPAERSAVEIVDAALAWLAQEPAERPFFLWAHFYDPHGPYEPPPGFPAGPSDHERYLAEVTAMDAELGRLFDALRADGRLASTFVLVVADHGESFGEHGEFGHGSHCYDTTLRVPLLLRHPDGRDAGTTRDEVVSVVDVFPTLTEAMGLAVRGDVDGQSLLHAPTTDDRGVYFESYNPYFSFSWSPLVGWRDGEGKYIHSTEPELYRTARDPAEERDELPSHPDGAASYRAAIARTLRATALTGRAAEVEPHLAEGIRDLGYASAGRSDEALPDPLAPLDLPSPRSRRQAGADMVRAVELTRAGEVDAARELYRAILRENPRNWFVHEKLASLLLQARDFEGALVSLEALVAGGRTKAITFYKLGLCLRAAGRLEEAVAALEQAVELSRNSARFEAALERTRRELDEE